MGRKVAQPFRVRLTTHLFTENGKTVIKPNSEPPPSEVKLTMTKYQITPKKLAVFLHNTYEKEAKNLGWKTQKSCRSKKFSELPLENQQLMIFVADKIIRKLQSYGKGHDDFSKYYVIPDCWLLNLEEINNV